ncbi:hypothetical protein [Methylobacterium hispanicum]|uniref:hypothetical protein n=1 Tax=Methylobacterium hispanicum TaxID=270350 RepID=UPI002F2FD344
MSLNIDGARADINAKLPSNGVGQINAQRIREAFALVLGVLDGVDTAEGLVASGALADALAGKLSTAGNADALKFAGSPLAAGLAASGALAEALGSKANATLSAESATAQRPLVTWLADRITPLAYGAVGDGATNDFSALANAIYWAGVRAKANRTFVSIDLCGRVYGVGQTLFVTPRNVGFVNGGLTAVGTWADKTKPVLSFSGGSGNGFLRNVVIDCMYLCSGVRIQEHGRFSGDNVRVLRPASYGYQSLTTATELALVKCWSQEYGYNDVGRTDGTPKQSIGFDIQTSDAMLTQCFGVYGRVGIRVSGGAYTVICNQCHVYSDKWPLTSVYDGFLIEADAHSTQLNNCACDDAVVTVKNFDTLITGMRFEHTSQGAETVKLALVAQKANETGAGLRVVGCRFNGTATGEIQFLTEGSGTWITSGSRLCQIWENQRPDGSFVTPTGRLELPALATTAGQDASTSVNFTLNGADLTNKLYRTTVAGSSRWAFGMLNTNDWGVYRYDANGVFAESVVTINFASGQMRTNKAISQGLATSVSPISNRDMTFQYVSDTQLRVLMKGADGVVRSTALTLS